MAAGCKRQEVPLCGWRLPPGNRDNGVDRLQGSGLRAPLAPARRAARGAQEQPAGGAPRTGTKPGLPKVSASLVLKVTAQVTHPQGHDFQVPKQDSSASTGQGSQSSEIPSLCLLGPGGGVQPPGAPGGVSRLLHTETLVTGTHSPPEVLQAGAPETAGRWPGTRRRFLASGSRPVSPPTPTPAAGRGRGVQGCRPRLLPNTAHGCRRWGKRGARCVSKPAPARSPQGAPNIQ